MSPWVATTRLSLVATITLQPVPQKRHGALSHFSSLAARSVTRLAASAGTGIPPASGRHRGGLQLEDLAAIELGCGHDSSPDVRSVGVDGVKDERGGIDVGQQRDGVERRSERAGVRRVDHDDELALGIAAVDLASGQRRDRGFHARRGARAAPAPECWRSRRRAARPRDRD